MSKRNLLINALLSLLLINLSAQNLQNFNEDWYLTGFDSYDAQLVPYYAWANRGSAEMSVWLPIVW